jgi:hypothetical protein
VLQTWYPRRHAVNLLVDNLHPYLIISDNAENPSEGAVACYQYPKVTIEISNFVIGEKALDLISTSPVCESGLRANVRHQAETSKRVNS